MVSAAVDAAGRVRGVESFEFRVKSRTGRVKILFVNQFYWPDAAATAQQLSDLAEHLADAGHQVQVLCSARGYDANSSSMRPRRELRRGVQIHRLAGPGFGKRTTVGRVVDYAVFHLLCGLWCLCFGWRFRVVVTLTSPPLVGLYGMLVRAMTFGGTRHVCWSMDLHPDCEFALGLAGRKNPIWRLVDLLNTVHFRLADATVALGRCMQGRLRAKGVREERLRVIGVWNPAGSATQREVDALRSRYGWSGRFVVMYAGNAGLIHSFDAVCEAMRRLDRVREVQFVFVGGGKRLAEVESYVRRHTLRNFVHHAYVEREQLGAMLAAADVHLVTMRPGLEGMAVPSKLYGIMGASRPVLYVGPSESETARATLEADCGRVIDPEGVDALVAAICELARDSSERERLGGNGRRYFLARHERGVCCREWERVIESVAAAVAWHPDAAVRELV